MFLYNLPIFNSKLILNRFILIEIGWRAIFSPADHPVCQYEFDVLIGADGKRNTLEGTDYKKIKVKNNLFLF